MYSNVPLGFCLDNFFSSGDLAVAAAVLAVVVVVLLLLLLLLLLLVILNPLILWLSGSAVVAAVAVKFRDV